MVGTRGKLVGPARTLTTKQQIALREEAAEAKALETSRRRSEMRRSLNESAGSELRHSRELVTETLSQKAWEYHKWNGLGAFGSWKPSGGDPSHFSDFVSGKGYRGTSAPLVPVIAGYHVVSQADEGADDWLVGNWEYSTSAGSTTWSRKSGPLDMVKRRLWTRQVQRTVYKDSGVRQAGGVKVNSTEELQQMMRKLDVRDESRKRDVTFEGQMKDVEAGQVWRFTLEKNTLTAYDHGGKEVRACSLHGASLELYQDQDDTNMSLMPQIMIQPANSSIDEVWILEFCDDVPTAHIMKSTWFIRMHYAMNSDKELSDIPVSKPDLRRVPGGEHDWLEVHAVWVSNTHHFASYVGDISNAATCVADKSLETYWQADPQSKSAWIVIDLQQPAEVSRFVYFNKDGSKACPRRCKLMFGSWVESNTWCLAHEWTGDQKEGFSDVVSFEPQIARYWKFCIQSTYGDPGPKVALVMFRGTHSHGSAGHASQYGLSVQQKRERWSSAAEDPELWSDPGRVFDTLDVNRDGAITGVEFEEWYLLSGFKDRVLNTTFTGPSTVQPVSLTGSPAENPLHDGTPAPLPLPNLLDVWHHHLSLGPPPDTQPGAAGESPELPADMSWLERESKREDPAMSYVAKAIRDDNVRMISQHFDSILEQQENYVWHETEGIKQEIERLQDVSEKLNNIKSLPKDQVEAPAFQKMLMKMVAALREQRRYLREHRCKTYREPLLVEEYAQRVDMLVSSIFAGGVRDQADNEIDAARRGIKAAQAKLAKAEELAKSGATKPVCTAYASQEIANLVHKSVPPHFWEDNRKYLPQVLMPRCDGQGGHAGGSELPGYDISFYLREEDIDRVMHQIRLHKEHYDRQPFHYWLTFVPNFSGTFYEQRLMPLTTEIDPATENYTLLSRSLHPTVLSITMVPVEHDLISMEIEHDLRQIALEEGKEAISGIISTAHAQIDRLFGPTMNIVAKGTIASEASRKLGETRREGTQFSPRRLLSKSRIGHSVILDRTCDMVTPMLTQFTYAGLLDEIFDTWDEIVCVSGWEKGVRFCFSSEDPLWEVLRDLPIEVVDQEISRFHRQQRAVLDEVQAKKEQNEQNPGSVRPGETLALKARAEQAARERPIIDCHSRLVQHIISVLRSPAVKLSSYRNNFSTGGEYPALIAEADELQYFENQNQSVNTYEELFFQLNTFARNCKYADAPEICDEYFVDSVRRHQPMFRVVRLLCLMALTGGGLDPEKEREHKQEMIDKYGYNAWQLCRNLIEANALAYKSLPYDWDLILRTFKLTVDYDPENHANYKQVFGRVYAPLAVRLVEEFIQHKWRHSTQDLDALVMGPTNIIHSDEEADFAVLEQSSSGVLERRDTGRAGHLEIRCGFYSNRWGVLQGGILNLYKKPAHHAQGKSPEESVILKEYTLELEKGTLGKTEVVLLLTALPETKSYSNEKTVRLRIQAGDAALEWDAALAERCSSSSSSGGSGNCGARTRSGSSDGVSDVALPRLVWFVGGVTYAELAAIRDLTQNLSATSGKREQIVVLTTSITNGKSILRSLEADFVAKEH